MITSSTERLASDQVKTTTVQNEDLEISSPCAAPGAANMNLPESVGFSRGQQSLDHSVWYNGALMTFLATGEDTHGQFALIEAVGRKGSDAPPHIHHREDEIFYVLEGEIVFSVSDRTNQGHARHHDLLTTRRASLVHHRIRTVPDAYSCYPRRV